MENTGEKLKKIRLEKGISLEEVQKKTRIHLNILKAIEGQSLTNLSPIYLKGFLKIYCKFLGVDPAEYITDYRESSYKVSEKAASKAEKTVQVKEEKKVFKAPAIKLPSLRLTKKAINVLVFLVIIMLLWVLLFNFVKFLHSRKSNPRKTRIALLSERKEAKKAVKAEQMKPVVPALKTQAGEVVAPKEVITGIRLGIRTNENCWISLKVDGKLVFQRVLEKGRFESWQAKNKIELSLGNAGAVELEVNGQVFSNLGRRKQSLKNILITKEGLKIGK